MQLLLSIKTNAGHKFLLFLNNYFDFISSVEFLVQTVFIFNFGWVLEISFHAQHSVVHFHKFFVLLVFRFHVSKAHSLFRYIFRKNSSFVFTFKNHRCYFQTAHRKITPKAYRSTVSSQLRIRQWHDCLRFTLSMVYRVWTNVSCSHYFSSFILFDNVLWIDCLHFSLLSVLLKISSKTENIKAASIPNIYMTVKMKVKMLYVDANTLYKHLS